MPQHQIREDTRRDKNGVLVAPPATLRRRIPSATYRLQFNAAFTFREAAGLVAYLADLGVTDCYSSPYLKACPGSMHGYDVIDHNALNPEVGGEEQYGEFIAALQQHGMGQLLDIVPNHMGIAAGKNAWWNDVLENGPSSPFASFFDIDWTPLKEKLANKVLLPILGDQYGRVLEDQHLTLEYENGAFYLLVYGKTRLPVAPRPVTLILRHRLEQLEAILGADHPSLLELQSIITALTHLPLRTETDPERIRERQREKEVIKRRLARLTDECREVHDFLHENVRQFNGEKGQPGSFDLLDQLLDDQAYYLAYWRVASEEINYRRFFDINELAALRTEDPAVFAATHRFVLQLFAEGKITGFRIDHIDGLYEPAEYLRRLQHACHALRSGEPLEQVLASLHEGNGAGVERPGFALAAPDLPCYVVVEKILGVDERLPESWPIDGSSGYDALASLNNVFVDAEQEKACTEIYTRFSGVRTRFSDLVYECKKLIMQVALAGELNVLAHQLSRIAEKNRHSRDFTLNGLRRALREVVACFPVYRTYINYGGVSNRDRVIIEAAVNRAKRRNPAADPSIFDFIQQVLLLGGSEQGGDSERLEQLSFVMKFQQYTGPVMAKGLEDTAFYRYHRLTSLNEVGSAPDRFGNLLTAFHNDNLERLTRWPHALVATTTHDTKRSEDVRARIHVLSEIPQEWKAALRRWSKLNKKKKLLVDGQPVPDPNVEYLLYQTLLGAWPLLPMNDQARRVFQQRLQEYMRKATKEAKENTSWINPNRAYDDALQHFVAAVIDDPIFAEHFAPLAEKVAQYGMYNSLSQTLLKLTIPGVPDIYQGNEIWDFSLVDPDNRRPVDYEQRRRMLDALRRQIQQVGTNLVGVAQSLVETRKDGRIKLYVTHQTLAYRRKHPELFLYGEYLPLVCDGVGSVCVCAFARQYEDQQVLVAAPRLLTRLSPNLSTPPLGSAVWRDAQLFLSNALAARRYRNVFTGEVLETIPGPGQAALPLANVFAHFPVALLEQETAM
ncbi:MAG TPA: malto-oligosyltrehalose synthase [Methylomirabilota bacterium]|nr:malto-oligosyltrehalose synthase [Methylomirabilota bacterium]